MMTNLYPYSESAIAFVEEQLVDGLTLASFVLRNSSPLKGVALLCVDHGGRLRSREMSLLDWHSGVGAKVDSGMDCLVSFIHDFLDSNVNRLCIVENAVAKPSDARLDNQQSQIATYHQEEVYHILQGGARRSEIGRAIREARSAWMMLGYLVDLQNMHEIRGEISVEEMELLSQNVAVCFMEAFDGEGYLLWKFEQG